MFAERFLLTGVDLTECVFIGNHYPVTGKHGSEIACRYGIMIDVVLDGVRFAVDGQLAGEVFQSVRIVDGADDHFIPGESERFAREVTVGLLGHEEIIPDAGGNAHHACILHFRLHKEPVVLAIIGTKQVLVIFHVLYFCAVLFSGFTHDAFQIGGRKGCHFPVFICKSGLEIEMLRIILCQHLVISGVKRHCGGDHHQHACRENGNRGKSHGILLHPIEKSSDRRHILRAVVEFLVFTEHFQHEYTSCDKEKIRAGDDQEHCHKKEH